jgi:hypothetical protein
VRNPLRRLPWTARVATVACLVAAAALSRLLPHPPNFTPLAAMALFAGAFLPPPLPAVMIPLAAMLASDLFLGFHDQMPAVYLSFALTVALGRILGGRRRPAPLALAALSASALFFALTNFGVWAAGSLYPRTFEGLATCYTAALPFFRNTLFGDLLYTAVLFGGFALLERRVPVLARETGGAG